jgi:hypothetical protein
VFLFFAGLSDPRPPAAQASVDRHRSEKEAAEQDPKQRLARALRPGAGFEPERCPVRRSLRVERPRIERQL